MALANLIEQLLGGDLPIGVVAYDGSRAGPDDPPATLVIRSPDALRRALTAPGELGFVRAYVAGDIEVEGDIFAVLEFRRTLPRLKVGVGTMRSVVGELGGWRQVRRLEPPPEEIRLRGRRHSAARDSSAISAHYDLSNRFYEMVLGPSLTYSCAVFEAATDSIEQAQANKHELICRKVGIGDGDRLLDIGCGWGSTVLHAVRHHGAKAVGITVSREQAALATKRVAEAGLSDEIEIRLQDYRDVDDGPYDAVTSVGMFEHVGERHLAEYFGRIAAVLKPAGRVLNHGIGYPPGERARLPRRSFVNRYVFPDAELHEVGKAVSLMQRAGLEVRHVESLREHYALTLRQWVANVDEHWEDVVDEVGVRRARVWRLAMAGASINFDQGNMHLHQVLAVRCAADGRAHMALRPSF